MRTGRSALHERCPRPCGGSAGVHARIVPVGIMQAATNLTAPLIRVFLVLSKVPQDKLLTGDVGFLTSNSARSALRNERGPDWPSRRHEANVNPKANPGRAHCAYSSSSNALSCCGWRKSAGDGSPTMEVLIVIIRLLWVSLPTASMPVTSMREGS